LNAVLRSKHVDVLYKLKLKETDNYGYVLFTVNEHQSVPVKIMPLRTLCYESRVMYRHWELHKKVPLVHNIVYYNAKKPWNYSRDIFDLIDAPPELCKQYALSPFHLVNAQDIPDSILLQHQRIGALTMMMKHIHDRDFMPTLIALNDLLKTIRENSDLGDGQENVAALLYYACSKGRIFDEQTFETVVYTHLNEQKGAEIITLLERKFQQGIQSGMEQGMQQGERQTIKKLLAGGAAHDYIAQLIGVSKTVLKQLQDEIALENAHLKKMSLSPTEECN
jgi:predicted transposase/invertase (TIGR01784 family)